MEKEMGATSVSTEEEKKPMTDDLSDAEVKAKLNVDLGKLAALKAKSQAKQENQMAAKIVSSKERSLAFGVLGSGQAGCVDGSTNIYLSKYGIISIKDFFYKMLSNTVLTNINTTGDKQTCIKIDDQEVYTIAIDPETGEVKKAKVKAVWKNRKSIKNKITMENGTTLLCSKTHPSLVFRPNSRRKAFFSSLTSSTPLSKEDRMVDTRLQPLDLISEKTYIRETEVTEEIAWLLGAFAGDGHNRLNGNEISFYSDDEFFTKKIVEISNKIPHSSISINDQPGCEKISLYGLQARLFFESAFNYNIESTYGGAGAKTYTIDVPTCVSAASLNIRIAFLAGLIDSDGTVSKDWFETSIFTCSEKMSDKISCLISSIGARSVCRKIEPKRENESVGYDVAINGKINHGPLLSNLVKQISHSMKKERLIDFSQRDQKSFATSSIPLSFDEISFWMKQDGEMKNVNNLSEKSDVSLKCWARGESSLSINSFNKMMEELKSCEQIDYVKSIAPKLLKIESIESVDESECEFFDLTVETYENYVAGNNGFIFTHNSRLAEYFYKLGYPACVCNTAMQDLKFIDVPDSNKLLLEFGVGGASKELDIGRNAAEMHRSALMQLINDRLSSSQINILCLSLGGGSGAGSCETLVDLMSSLGKPLIVLAALPMESDDAHAKSNALETLAKLSVFVKSSKISNLIVVDNAKLESIYSDVNQMDFFSTANKAIVEPIDIFNTLSSMASATKALDPMELSKILVDGGGLTVYGQFTVKNYQEDTAIAEAVINNLANNLLADGFDLKQSKYVGFMVVANKDVWAKIPASSINYASSMINDLCGNPKGVFKGMYVVDSQEDSVKVYSMFSGLGLPTARVEQLKKDTHDLQSKVKVKDDQRNLTLNLDTGTSETVSAAQKIKEKIASKSSTFGKFVTGVTDRRK